MTFDQLKEKALSLPYEPGVYLMRDKTDTVIYVGKAKKLKNRVSQYFQDTASHTPKTRMMVSRIDHFDVIVAASEFEALVLECSLIKRYSPKYNILLKDDKGYPYLRLDLRETYPKITLAPKIAKDGAGYFGPFGSRSTSWGIISAIEETFRLPSCHKVFPRDIDKERPCLNYHMGRCDGWCRGGADPSEYRRRVEQVKQLLGGNYKAVAEALRRQMESHAENLEFELAAAARDRLQAVEALGKRQLVTALSMADTDVVGFAQTEAKACFAVLHFAGGNLLDKDYEVLPVVDDPAEAVSSLLKQYYLSHGTAPKRVLLPFAMEDGALFEELFEQKFGQHPKFHVPQRGEQAHLVDLANKNAQEEALRVTGAEERISGTLVFLGKMLSMEPPGRMESFDISNISGTDIVASMVVFQDGKPKKSDYKRFKVEGLEGQDDYASMEQVVRRRFVHLKAQDPGFSEAPDLLLIDGGVAHANVAKNVLSELKLDIPVYGMVKDDRHRTRALVTPAGDEVAIDANPSVFALIGRMQEETHRFAITYHRQLRSKRLRYSELDGIPGIGPKRKQELLKTFKSLTAMGEATLPELERLLPRDAAQAVYDHFRRKEGEKQCE